LLEYQNFLQHPSLFLRFQQSYFDGLTKLFSDPYSVKLYIPQNRSFRVAIVGTFYIYFKFLFEIQYINL